MKKTFKTSVAALFMIGFVNMAMADCNTEQQPFVTYDAGKCTTLFGHVYCDIDVPQYQADCWEEFFPE